MIKNNANDLIRSLILFGMTHHSESAYYFPGEKHYLEEGVMGFLLRILFPTIQDLNILGMYKMISSITFSCFPYMMRGEP